VCLPFDLEEVVENLRMERYAGDRQYGSSEDGLIARMYYAVRLFCRLLSAGICNACT